MRRVRPLEVPARKESQARYGEEREGDAKPASRFGCMVMSDARPDLGYRDVCLRRPLEKVGAASSVMRCGSANAKRVVAAEQRASRPRKAWLAVDDEAVRPALERWKPEPNSRSHHVGSTPNELPKPDVRPSSRRSFRGRETVVCCADRLRRQIERWVMCGSPRVDHHADELARSPACALELREHGRSGGAGERQTRRESDSRKGGESPPPQNLR